MNPDGRLKAHKNATKWSSTHHYLFARLAIDEESVAAVIVPEEEQDDVAQRLAAMCPRLAERNPSTKQCPHVLLITGEAIFTAAGRFDRGNVVYHHGLTRFLGAPNSQVVGLNSTSCLTTGIAGFSLKTVRSPRDLEAGRMGLLDSMVQEWAAVSDSH